MKKLIFTALLACATFITFAQSRSLSTIKKVLINDGYTIADTYNGDFSEGQSGIKNRTFYANNEYKIVAFSTDSDVSDIDLYIKYDDGTVYAKDNDNTSLCVVNFTPSYTRDMDIKVVNYKSYTPNYESTIHVIVAYK